MIFACRSDRGFPNEKKKITKTFSIKGLKLDKPYNPSAFVLKKHVILSRQDTLHQIFKELVALHIFNSQRMSMINKKSLLSLTGRIVLRQFLSCF